MEPDETMLLLCSLKSVWDGETYLCLDDVGIPVLSGWYEENEGDKRVHKEWKYLKDKWVEQTDAASEE